MAIGGLIGAFLPARISSKMATAVICALLASFALRSVHRAAKAELDARSGELAVAAGAASVMEAAAEAAAEELRLLAPQGVA